MQLQDQVVSLNLAKRMKELGFTQESLFYWADDEDGNWVLVHKTMEVDNDYIMQICEEIKENEDGAYVSAYTVAELGEILRGKWVVYKIQDGWNAIYEDMSITLPPMVKGVAKTEADARAKLAIYLAENHLINQ